MTMTLPGFKDRKRGVLHVCEIQIMDDRFLISWGRGRPTACSMR